MSFGRLLNPLDGFTTYSTHFVLLACRTTEHARDFSQAGDTATLQAIDQTTDLGSPVVFGNSNSDVFLVMDTRRFSQFTVDKMKYEVFINGLTTGGSHANLATGIEMTILDSVGISFINYLQWLMDSKMQCGFDGMIFMIRVIFVGHHEDGSTETIQTVTIPAHLFKIDVNLDYAKGVYDCVFMPNFNFSVNTHQRWLNIGTATNYNTQSGNTLGEMIDSFETSLNKDSSDFYQSISARILEAGGDPTATVGGKFGRLVQYQITIPDDWRKFECDGPSTHNAIEKAFVKTAAANQTAPQKAATAPGKDVTPATSSYISVDPGQTIPQVVEVILKSCSATREFGNADKLTSKSESITFYKFLVSVSSDDASFIVHVDVIPFVVPNVVPPQSNSASTTPSSVYEKQIVDAGTGRTITVPTNYFEFDYIFTGKNLDILHFDMKLENLQFLLASNVKTSQGELYNVSSKGQTDQTAKAVKQVDPFFTSSRQYDPMMIPLMSKEQRAAFSQYVTARTLDENARKIADSQSYARNLSSFYAQSAVMCNMTIRGNPDIMQKFNFEKPVLHTPSTSATDAAAGGTSTTNSSVKSQYRQDLEKDILRLPGAARSATSTNAFTVNRPLGDASYVTSPVFAKINIKGPNVDAVTNELIDGQDFATEVLYNNYYVVFKVVNSIERGVFTQQLELWSHNVYGEGKLTAENVKQQQARSIP